MNHLIVIGYTGIGRAYLNISREEAIKRFIDSGGGDLETVENTIHEFDFDDMFGVYSAYAVKSDETKT